MKLVIKIGGSLSVGDSGPDYRYFSRLLPALKAIKKRHQLIVVIGGGRLARKYISIVKKFRISEKNCEWVAIYIVNINRKFLSAVLGMNEIKSLGEIGPKTRGVLGGIAPGRSTDANAAYAASAIRADMLIKLTDVDGVYEKDPKTHKNAKKLYKISFSDLGKISKEGSAGNYGIMDSTAIGIITKSRIKTVIISGARTKDLLKAIAGRHVGTVIGD